MKKISLFCILSLTVLNLTGCWGNKQSFMSLINGQQPISYIDNNVETYTQEDYNTTNEYDTTELNYDTKEISNQEEIIEDKLSINEIRDLRFIESQGTLRVNNVSDAQLDIPERTDIKTITSYVDGYLMNEDINVMFEIPFTANIQVGDELYVTYKAAYNDNKTYISDITYKGEDQPYTSFEQNPDIFDGQENINIINDENSNSQEVIIDNTEEIQEIEETTVEETKPIETVSEENNNSGLDNIFTVTEGVNVRNKASINSKVVGKLEAGTQIEVIELSANGSWAKFILNGEELWVSTKYIK